VSLIKRGRDLERFFKGRSFILDSPGVRSERLKDGRVQVRAHRKPKASKLVPPVPIRAGPVLLWDTNCNFFGQALSRLQAVYAGLSIPTDLSGTWSGNLNDYGTIIWCMAESDPSWWPQIVDGTWLGRLHVTAEASTNPTTQAYVNSKAPLHGMTVAPDDSAIALEYNTPSSDPLAQGLSSLGGGATASVSGGITLFTNPTLALPMMQRTQPTPQISWIVCGDSNHATDYSFPTIPAINAAFFANLVNVPL
jgi:hypothetical protein